MSGALRNWTKLTLHSHEIQYRVVVMMAVLLSRMAGKKSLYETGSHLWDKYLSERTNTWSA